MTETQSKNRIEVTIRPRVPEDDERIVAIDNRINSDFPAYTVEMLRYRIETRPAESSQERWVAEREGEVLGRAALIQFFGRGLEDRYFGHVAIDPDRWGQGIGSQMYDHLLRRAQEVGARKLYSDFREHMPEAERFATERGFKRTGHIGRLSRLPVARANLDGYEGIEDRLAESGLRVATLADIGMDDEEFLHALHIMAFESARDIPMSEELTDPWPYDSWIKGLTGPGNSLETTWIALDGKRPVGFAALTIIGDAADNDYTGVDREYRGRGVARALKLKTIEWSRANGIEYIYTGNDIENKRMLSINIRLGYEPLPGEVEVVKEV